MNLYCFKLFFLLLFLLPTSIWCQDPLFWENEFAVNTKLNPRWKLNIGVANRNQISEDLGNEPFSFDGRHIQFELNSGYEVGFYSTLGGGVMYRFNTLQGKSAQNELRLTQQYSIAKTYNSLRLVHRFKTDQRLFNSSTEHRLRYRLSIDFPLQGLRLDKGEFYIVTSTESVFNTGTTINPMWDQRLVGAIGNQISKSIKAQIDIEYRFEDWAQNLSNRWFIVTGIICKL